MALPKLSDTKPSGRYSLLLISILAIAAAICFYYFLFLTGRETLLNKRYFRVMQRIQNNLGVSVDGNIKLVEGHAFAVKNYLEKGRPGEAVDKKITQQDLDSLNKAFDAPWSNWPGSRMQGLCFDSIYISKSDTLKDGLYNLPGEDSVFRIIKSVFRERGRVRLQFSFTISSVLKPLLRKGVLDEYVLVRKDHVAYETFASGLQPQTLDSLFVAPKELSSASVRTVHLGGNDFRVYIQPVSLAGKNDWALIGLKSSDSFAALKHAIPRNYLFTVFLLVFFAILSLPFIKSLIMSRTERLTTFDVILSCLSLIIITSSITLLFLDGYLYFTVDKTRITTTLQCFSTDISSRLDQELHTDYKQMQAYDDSIGRVSKKTGAEISAYAKAYGATLPAQYNSLYMADSSGKTIYDTRDKYSFDISTRRYFKSIIDSNYFYMNGGNEAFFLDAIVSWRVNQFRAVLSMPVKNSLSAPAKPKVVVMSTELKSITNPIIPENYGFCIIDEKGAVIFHSEKDRALNENFVEECGNNAALNAALYGRTENTIDLDYSGEAVKANVRPLNNLPYFLVTYTSSVTLDAQHGQLFGITLSMQLFGLLIYVGLAFAAYLSVNHRSRLRIPRFSFAFYLPKKDNNINYHRAIVFNFLHGISLLCFTAIERHPVFIIYVLFTAPVLSVIYNYHLLSGIRLFELKKYNRLIRRNISGGTFLLLLINFSALFYLDNFLLFLAWEVLAGLFYAVVSEYVYPGKTFTCEGRALHVDYRKAFFMLVYLLVLISCVLPVARFAELAYNKEQEIAVKKEQLDMAAVLSKQGKNYAPADFSKGKLLNNYASCFNQASITFTPLKGANISPEEAFFETNSAKLRALIQSGGSRSRLLDIGASDTSWFWQKKKDTLALVVTSPVLLKQSLRDTVVFSSVLPRLPYPGFFRIEKKGTEYWKTFFYVLYFWSLLVLLLGVLYRILCFFVRKLFAPEAFDGNNFKELDYRFFKESQPEYRIFVTGLPCSGKSDYFIELYKDKVPFQLLDLIRCQDKEEWDKEVAQALALHKGTIMIDHFEFDYLSSETNKLKLELLEKLALQQESRVIIISAIHPQAFLELYSRPGATEGKLHDEQLANGDRWNKALACFCHLFYPLQGYQETCAAILVKQGHAYPKAISELIVEECSHGYFLCNIGQEMFRELSSVAHHYRDAGSEGRRFIREDLILKIQKLAHVYYLSIWSALTKEEQYVLFDLAQDGVMNSKNMDVMATLVDKGLVIHQDELLPMNKSFRNFILSVIEPSDMMKMEEKVRNSGTWNRWKMPLFVIVCALVFFVLRTDQNEMVTYITTFAAGIPLIINLVAMLGQFGKKKE